MQYDSILDTVAIRVLVDDHDLEAQAAKAVAKVRKTLEKPVNVNVKAGAATKGMSEALAQAKALNNEAATLRQRFQATGQEFTKTRDRLQGIKTQALELSKAFADDTVEARRFAQAARYADATIAGMEGRMSRLGLASQVNLAATNALQNQLYRFGPIGQVVGGSLGAVGGGLTTVSAGAVAATAGIAGIAAVGYELTRRGIPEVKETQKALRTLIATGEDFTRVKLDAALQKVADAAGKAGMQFDRSDLATALAEIVKAGVPAADAIRACSHYVV